ncbi:MAG: hypothetical protein Q4C66_01160 [Lachnospiraceae bacterium]|nr:hypothetical protein [Lachnospiraceae bacterium]
MNENEMKQNTQDIPKMQHIPDRQNESHEIDHVLEELEGNSSPVNAPFSREGAIIETASEEPIGEGSVRKESPQDPSEADSAPDKRKEDSSQTIHSRKVLSSTEEPGYIRRSPARSWFNTFMIMNIPIIGWLYLLILAFGKKDQRKDFAKAYLIYKLVFLLVALAIIALLLHVGMDAADQLLQYMDML